jgi:hypothetical protein
MKTNNQSKRGNMPYHGNSRPIREVVTVAVWAEVHQWLHEQATKTGHTQTDIASMVMMKFAESGQEIPMKRDLRPTL